MRCERGSAALLLTALVAVVMGLIFLNSMQVVSQVSHKFYTVQAKGYAVAISSSLARQLRWSFDIARAVQADSRNASLCDTFKGASIVSVGPVKLCLTERRSCILHPAASDVEICVSPEDGSLFAKAPLRPPLWWLVSEALALDHTPPEPPAAETNNHLLTNPVCLGGSCQVVCGGNADCLSFSFCPLASASCSQDERVWQTLAFDR